MATTSYQDILAGAQQLSLDEQRRLRDELDAILPDRATSTREERLTPGVRPGLRADLEALDDLAAQIGAAWQSDRNAAEIDDQIPGPSA